MKISKEVVDFILRDEVRRKALDLNSLKSLPSTLQALLFPLEAAIRAGVVEHITSAADSTNPITVEFLRNEQSNLTRYGFSDDIAQQTLAIIVAHAVACCCLKRLAADSAISDREFTYDPFSDVQTFGELLLAAFECLLCGMCSGVNEDAAAWLLGIASKYGDSHAECLLGELEGARHGNRDAIRSLISYGYERWASIVRPTLHSNWSFHPDSLGMTYGLMSKMEGDPVIALRLGLMLWEFGHAGEDERGRRLIASAALAGNKGAWLTIKRLTDNGDWAMIDELISVGVALATVEDVDPDPDPDSDY